MPNGESGFGNAPEPIEDLDLTENIQDSHNTETDSGSYADSVDDVAEQYADSTATRQGSFSDSEDNVIVKGNQTNRLSNIQVPGVDLLSAAHNDSGQQSYPGGNQQSQPKTARKRREDVVAISLLEIINRVDWTSQYLGIFFYPPKSKRLEQARIYEERPSEQKLVADLGEGKYYAIRIEAATGRRADPGRGTSFLLTPGLVRQARNSIADENGRHAPQNNADALLNESIKALREQAAINERLVAKLAEIEHRVEALSRPQASSEFSFARDSNSGGSWSVVDQITKAQDRSYDLLKSEYERRGQYLDETLRELTAERERNRELARTPVLSNPVLQSPGEIIRASIDTVKELASLVSPSNAEATGEPAGGILGKLSSIDLEGVTGLVDKALAVWDRLSRSLPNKNQPPPQQGPTLPAFEPPLTVHSNPDREDYDDEYDDEGTLDLSTEDDYDDEGDEPSAEDPAPPRTAVGGP